MGGSVGLWSRMQWVVTGALCLGIGGGAAGDINLEFRPATQSGFVGNEIRIELYAVSDNPKQTQFSSAVQTILSWDPSVLQLLGVDQSGATPLQSSGFPNDPHGLNEANPPQDGDGIHVALANFNDPIPATPAGTLITTFVFEALAPTPLTPVDILVEGGDPPGRTTVFDADQPNTDVTGSLSGAVVIVEEPPGPKLLLLTDEMPVDPGDTVEVELWMTRLTGNEAAGFQAYLFYNTDELTFISAVYTDEPFGLPIITGSSINPNPGEIDLASGINNNEGQLPTSEDSLLVTMTFMVKPDGGGCLVTGVGFRKHSPPTRLSDNKGNALKPLALCALPLERACPADVFPFGGNGVVNVDDLLTVINGWGVCPPTPPCCASDANSTGVTDVDDLKLVINNWGPCP